MKPALGAHDRVEKLLSQFGLLGKTVFRVWYREDPLGVGRYSIDEYIPYIDRFCNMFSDVVSSGSVKMGELWWADCTVRMYNLHILRECCNRAFQPAQIVRMNILPDIMGELTRSTYHSLENALEKALLPKNLAEIIQHCPKCNNNTIITGSNGWPICSVCRNHLWSGE
jgi:hypothetical protein